MSFEGLTEGKKNVLCDFLDTWVKNWMDTTENYKKYYVVFQYSDGTEKYYSLSSDEFKTMFYNFFKDKPFLYAYSSDRLDRFYEMSGEDMAEIFRFVIGFRIINMDDPNITETDKKRMKKNTEIRQYIDEHPEFRQKKNREK
jgi:hypothetical protein